MTEQELLHQREKYIGGFVIARNHTGHRVGQSHHRAKLTDAQVIEIREIKKWHGWSYKKIAEKFNCGESTVRDICKYWTRASA